MQQVSLFVNGTTDYHLLKGDTGPLVYPAFHVYLYSALYYLTNHGTNIFQAQCIFALLYLVTIVLVLACYRRVGAPPWLLATVVCSKRLHSIFLLRLFNDAWVAALLWGMIYAFQRKWWNAGAVSFTLGLGVKMSMLLVLPAAGVIVLQGHGTSEAAFIGMICAMAQMISSFPFLFEGEGWHYMSRAFDLGRKFLYKWTVNWRFVDEEVFSSSAFATSLLVVHVSLLLVFLQTRWIKPSSKGLGEFLYKYSRTMDHTLERGYEKNVTPTFVMDSVLGCMTIGLLCARSLHYQFYAYLGWATPYLLWRSGVHPVLVLANLALQEFAWLQYPSTTVSSITVVVELMVALASVWYGSAYQPEVKVEEEGEKAHSE
jgi:alpha-1,3-mannosyltransferase